MAVHAIMNIVSPSRWQWHSTVLNDDQNIVMYTAEVFAWRFLGNLGPKEFHGEIPGKVNAGTARNLPGPAILGRFLGASPKKFSRSSARDDGGPTQNAPFHCLFRFFARSILVLAHRYRVAQHKIYLNGAYSNNVLLSNGLYEGCRTRRGLETYRFVGEGMPVGAVSTCA